MGIHIEGRGALKVLYSTLIKNFSCLLLFELLFETKTTQSDSVVIGQFGHCYKEFGALPADSSATLSTVVLPLKPTKFNFANKTPGDLFAGPEGPLGNFNCFKPPKVRIFAQIGFSYGHSRDTDCSFATKISTKLLCRTLFVSFD